MADNRESEMGSAEVAKRIAVLQPHLIDGVPLTRVAAGAGIPIRFDTDDLIPVILLLALSKRVTLCALERIYQATTPRD